MWRVLLRRTAAQHRHRCYRREGLEFKKAMHLKHVPAAQRRRTVSFQNVLSGTLKYVFEIFRFCQPIIDFLALLFGNRGPPCENIGRDLHFAPVVGPF